MEYVLFSIYNIFNIWDNPSHWLSYFSRWLKPPTSNFWYVSTINPSEFGVIIIQLSYRTGAPCCKSILLYGNIYGYDCDRLDMIDNLMIGNCVVCIGEIHHSNMGFNWKKTEIHLIRRRRWLLIAVSCLQFFPHGLIRIVFTNLK